MIDQNISQPNFWTNIELPFLERQKTDALPPIKIYARQVPDYCLIKIELSDQVAPPFIMEHYLIVQIKNPTFEYDNIEKLYCASFGDIYVNITGYKKICNDIGYNNYIEKKIDSKNSEKFKERRLIIKVERLNQCIWSQAIPVHIYSKKNQYKVCIKEIIPDYGIVNEEHKVIITGENLDRIKKNIYFGCCEVKFEFNCINGFIFLDHPIFNEVCRFRIFFLLKNGGFINSHYFRVLPAYNEQDNMIVTDYFPIQNHIDPPIIEIPENYECIMLQSQYNNLVLELDKNSLYAQLWQPIEPRIANQCWLIQNNFNKIDRATFCSYATRNIFKININLSQDENLNGSDIIFYLMGNEIVTEDYNYYLSVDDGTGLELLKKDENQTRCLKKEWTIIRKDDTPAKSYIKIIRTQNDEKNIFKK